MDDPVRWETDHNMDGWPKFTSHDGLLYVSEGMGESANIYRIETDTGDLTLIESGGIKSANAGRLFCWTPDGFRVLDADTGQCVAHRDNFEYSMTNLYFRDGKMYVESNSGMAQDSYGGEFVVTTSEYQTIWKRSGENHIFFIDKIGRNLLIETNAEVHCINEPNGVTQWTLPLRKSYCLTKNGGFETDETTLYTFEDDTIVIIDVKTGEILRRISGDWDSIRQIVGMIDNILIVDLLPSGDTLESQIAGISKDGRAIWTWSTELEKGDLVSEMATPDNQRLFFIPKRGTEGPVTALDATTGDQIWKFNVSEREEALHSLKKESAVTPTDFDVTVVADDNVVYGIDDDTGEAIWTFGTKVPPSVWAKNGKIVIHSDSKKDHVYVLDGKTGELSWHWSFDYRLKDMNVNEDGIYCATEMTLYGFELDQSKFAGDTVVFSNDSYDDRQTTEIYDSIETNERICGACGESHTDPNAGFCSQCGSPIQ